MTVWRHYVMSAAPGKEEAMVDALKHLASKVRPLPAAKVSNGAATPKIRRNSCLSKPGPTLMRTRRPRAS